MQLAAERQLTSIAFPAISCGVYGYPVEQAARIAVSSIREFIGTYYQFEKIYLVGFSEGMVATLQLAVNSGS